MRCVENAVKLSFGTVKMLVSKTLVFATHIYSNGTIFIPTYMKYILDGELCQKIFRESTEAGWVVERAQAHRGRIEPPSAGTRRP